MSLSLEKNSSIASEALFMQNSNWLKFTYSIWNRALSVLNRARLLNIYWSIIWCTLGNIYRLRLNSGEQNIIS